MNTLEMQIKIKALRDELEERHKNGTIKLADSNGQPIPTLKLQNELYFLIYKLSRLK